MLKNRIWLGIILSIILLVFSINGFTAYYKYTQESGANFYVGTGDKADALEDTNEMRQIIDDLGALLVHSKRDDLYPKDLTTGGTIQIPEAGLKFGNDPVNNDIAAYIAGEMMWQTKAELGILTSESDPTVDTQGEIEAILTYGLDDTAGDGATDKLWSANKIYDELAALTYSDVGAIQDSTDTIKDTHIDWGVGANQVSTDDVTEGSTNKYFPGFTSLLVDYTFTDNSTNWNTAFGWGDHSTEGYLKVITGESIGDLNDVDTTGKAEGKILKFDASGNLVVGTDEGGAGATEFTGLTDTPANYTDQAGKYVKVNAGETALEFGTPEGAGTVTTSGTPEVNDIARFTGATVIEGLSYDELTTALALNSDDLSDVASIAMLDENEDITGAWTLSTGTIGTVTSTEFGYLHGVSSDVQTQLDAKKGKNYYSALGSDHTYSDNADTDSQPVGESVVFGDLLYFNWTDKEWKKTDADASTTMPGLRIALETKADGETCLMLVKGYIRDDSAFEFAGAMVYASVTPGATSSTAPTETGDQIQRVGVAKSADIFFFNPSMDVGEI